MNHDSPPSPRTAATADASLTGASSVRTASGPGLRLEVRLAWGGDLDIASVPVLSSALHVLAERRVRTVLLDLSAVAFMDCAGLGALLDADSRLGGGLRLVRPSGAVLRLLGLVELGPRLEVVEAPVRLSSVPDTVAVVEQSKGLIMAGFTCTADQAGKILLSTALRHNIQVQVLSALLVAVSAADLGHPPGAQAQVVRRVVGAAGGTTSPLQTGRLSHR